MMTERIGVIAPVGPPIWNREPPKIEIAAPAMIAVYSPRSGETPLAMANAMASGNATIPTITPASTSCRNRCALYPAMRPRNAKFTPVCGCSHSAGQRKSKQWPVLRLDHSEIGDREEFRRCGERLRIGRGDQGRGIRTPTKRRNPAVVRDRPSWTGPSVPISSLLADVISALAIAPPGQEGWLRHKQKVPKVPYGRRRGGG